MIPPLNAAPSLSAQCETSVPERWQRYLPLALAAAALLGLIPAIYFSGLRRIEYDSYRELFIATQERWRDFIEEGKAGAHPLLFHLIMRGVYHLGHSRLIYRMPGILATTGTAFLTGIIVRQLGGNAAFAVLATLASAFSGVSIEMAISMRSYPIAVLFIVLSFYYLLEALDLPEGRDAWKSCTVYSGALSLAILTEYFSVFYLVATIGLIVLRLTFDRPWRGRVARWMMLRPALVSISLVLPVLVTIFLLVVHFEGHPVNSIYYWVPSRESLPGFLARSLQLELRLLTPINVTGHDAALIVLSISAVLIVAIRFITRKRNLTPFLTWAPILILLMLLLEIATGALASRYPFGGQLRHQYILSPFLTTGFFVLAAQITSLLNKPAWRAACETAMLVGVLVVSYLAWRETPIAPEEHFAKDYAAFRSTVGHSDLICVDLFSLIGYFGLTHDWHWHSEWRYDRGLQPFIVYKTTSPSGEQVRLIRNKSQWNWNLKDPATYMIMAEELRFSGQTRMSFFYLEQFPDKISWPERQATMVRLANEQGLKVNKVFPLPRGMGAVFSLK